MPFVLLVSGACVCLGQPSPTASAPDILAVVDGDLARVAFDLPAGTPYQIDYPTSLENVWLDRQLTGPAAPLTPYAARSKGDLNGADIHGFSSALTVGPFDAEADFNDDSQLDTRDIPGFVEALLGSYPADGVLLYVQGLMPGDPALWQRLRPILVDEDVHQNVRVELMKLLCEKAEGLIASA